MESSSPNRRLIWEGRVYDVYAAIRADGSCPAGDFLDALKSGKLPGDADHSDAHLGPDERVHDFDWFVRAIKHFAEEGEPQYKGAINYLRSGIWEFRHGTLRLTFYDTSGGGQFRPKPEIVDWREADEPDSEYWHVPTFDEELRLGHWFVKESQTTTDEDLAEAEKIREEDLSHDKEE